MSTLIFNREMKRITRSTNSPVLKHIDGKFRKSYHLNYYGFFDDYMVKFGILSLNYSVTDVKNKYAPYINCSNNNIFNWKGGITELSGKFHSSSECQKMIVKSLVSNLQRLTIDELENWKFEWNYETSIN